jgi:hypothetical protein
VRCYVDSSSCGQWFLPFGAASGGGILFQFQHDWGFFSLDEFLGIQPPAWRQRVVAQRSSVIAVFSTAAVDSKVPASPKPRCPFSKVAHSHRNTEPPTIVPYYNSVVVESLFWNSAFQSLFELPFGGQGVRSLKMRTWEEARELQPKLRANQKTDRPLAVAQNAAKS